MFLSFPGDLDSFLFCNFRGDRYKTTASKSQPCSQDVKGMLYARLGIYPELQQLLLQDNVLNFFGRLGYQKNPTIGRALKMITRF